MGKKVVIIGAGFGGLALGIRLRAVGLDVTILDKQAYPGGQAQPLRQGGYRFDMGPSLLTAPELVEELFEIGGEIDGLISLGKSWTPFIGFTSGMAAT
jgi:phytoene desaturase